MNGIVDLESEEKTEEQFTREMHTFTERLVSWRENGITLWKDLSQWLGNLSIPRLAKVKKEWKSIKIINSARFDMLVLHAKGLVPDYLAFSDIRVHPSILKRLPIRTRKKIFNPSFEVEIYRHKKRSVNKRLKDLTSMEWAQILNRQTGELSEKVEDQIKQTMRTAIKVRTKESKSLPVAAHASRYDREDGQFVLFEGFVDGDLSTSTKMLVPFDLARKFFG